RNILFFRYHNGDTFLSLVFGLVTNSLPKERGVFLFFRRIFSVSSEYEIPKETYQIKDYS
ncbi:hypothetical protein P9764_11225, partial [Bacillus smithii]|uniref:hypothetical protein n=1 Tax=Bacillus smithii TaxID=1479 RepID=UPI002E2123B2|nr:hypothetical protein [Bacillus smithii]